MQKSGFPKIGHYVGFWQIGSHIGSVFVNVRQYYVLIIMYIMKKYTLNITLFTKINVCQFALCPSLQIYWLSNIKSWQYIKFLFLILPSTKEDMSYQQQTTHTLALKFITNCESLKFVIVLKNAFILVLSVLCYCGKCDMCTAMTCLFVVYLPKQSSVVIYVLGLSNFLVSCHL